MPFYDYRCDRCGSFRAQRPMRESGAAVPCPSCDVPAIRVIVPPFLGGKGGGGGGALGAFDRSRFRHVCGAGCMHPGR